MTDLDSRPPGPSLDPFSYFISTISPFPRLFAITSTRNHCHGAQDLLERQSSLRVNRQLYGLVRPRDAFGGII